MSDQLFFYKSHTHSASEMAKRLWFYVHSVGWYVCLPDYNLKRDSLYDFQIKYVVRGSGSVIRNGQTYHVGPKEVFFLDLNKPHRYHANPSDPWELLWVHFGGSQALDYFQLLENDSCPVYQVCNPLRIKQLFSELFDLFDQRPVGFEVLASSMITDVLSDLVVKKMEGGSENTSLNPPQYPEAIKRGIFYLEHHFSEPVNVKRISHEALLSPFHFSRLFKRTTGYTVMEYLIKFRLTQAKYLLMQTELPISEIAEKVGFNDQSYFGKVFKRYETLTPKEYRAIRSDPAAQIE